MINNIKSTILRSLQAVTGNIRAVEVLRRIVVMDKFDLSQIVICCIPEAIDIIDFIGSSVDDLDPIQQRLLAAECPRVDCATDDYGCLLIATPICFETLVVNKQFLHIGEK